MGHSRPIDVAPTKRWPTTKSERWPSKSHPNRVFRTYAANFGWVKPQLSTFFLHVKTAPRVQTAPQGYPFMKRNPFSLPSEHLSSHSQAKRHCPSVKQLSKCTRGGGKERCLLDSHSHSRLDKGRLRMQIVGHFFRKQVVKRHDASLFGLIASARAQGECRRPTAVEPCRTPSDICRTPSARGHAAY